MAAPESRLVVVGRIAGVYGVRGWVRVYSHTQPPANVLDYTPWRLTGGDRDLGIELEEGKVHGKGLVAKLEGIDDRDAAAELVGSDISVRREQLPDLGEGEYYWCDLIGLDVVTLHDKPLGRVDRLMSTGANDVLVVTGDRERLIPYVPDEVVRDIDLDRGLIRVDWDADF